MNQYVSKKLSNGKTILGFKNCKETMIVKDELKELELYTGDIINLNDEFYLVMPVLQKFDNGTRLDYFSLTKIGIQFKNPLTVVFNKNRNTLKMLEGGTTYLLGNIFNNPSELVLSSVLVKYSFKQYKPKIKKELNIILENLQSIPNINTKKEGKIYYSKYNPSKVEDSHNKTNK